MSKNFVERMLVFTPVELDVFARAFERAQRAASHRSHDPEEMKAILMTGIM